MKQLNQTSENLTVAQPRGVHQIAIQQLELKTKKGDKEDQNELKMLLTQFLSYPTNQLAELHMESDRLGTKDLRQEINERVSNSKQGSEQRGQLQFCPCCGFVKQENTLKICTHLGDINNIGISTYLYFQTVKNLIVMLLIMTLVYSVYAFITNLIASGKYNELIKAGTLTSIVNVSFGYVSISLGSKQMNPTDQNAAYYLVSCWIGVGLLVAWLFVFFILKHFEKEKEEKVEQDTISASDFTIMIQNAPIDLTQEQLQAAFHKYQKTFSTTVPAYLNKPLTIAKINKGKPFYLNVDDFKDDELDQMRTKHKQYVQLFVDWVKERQDSPTFSTTKDKRTQKYNEFKQLIQKQTKKYEEIGKKIQDKIKEETKAQTTTFFVTFQTSHAMKLVARLNDPSLSGRIRYYLTCCQPQNKFQFSRGQHTFDVKIERAPEPEDIIWTNLAVPIGEVIKRKIITFTATFILLGISFAIVYGLSVAQINSSGNSILSLVISIFISLVNIILSIVIEKLSVFEMDFTVTKYQTSLAVKSIFASLINSILIPIIVNYYIKTDIYSDKGLASDVFMLGLTNSFLPPILKLVNIPFIINRILKHLASRPTSRLAINQKDLNDKFQYVHFEVGIQYVYLVSTYFFTCFFVSLQPIIALFAFCGMGLMYWAQKYTLFSRMNRPVPGTDLVNVTMFQLLLFGGLIYSLGSLTWSNFMPSGIPKQALIPNLIAIGISIFMLLLPYRALLALCTSQQGIINQEFKKCRILLPSEYDRLNPTTAAEAFQQFKNYYEGQLKGFQKASEAQKMKLLDLFARQNARGHQRPPAQMMNGGGNPFNNLFQSGSMMPPPPQMMFMPPPPMFQQGFGFTPMMPGFQQPQQVGFQQLGFQNQNAFRPIIPMPGPTFVPAHLQPPGFQQRPVVQQQPGFQQPGFQQPFQQPGFQQRPVVQQPGFQPGFQQPGFQQPGFQQQQPGFQQGGFQQQPGFRAAPPQNFGFQPPSSNGFGFM